jgi:SAM-dependent methyltransferase
MNDIPVYSPDRYWGKVPQAELESALKVITDQGWDEFVGRYGKVFDVTFEENRADWRFVVPLTANSTVLDIGAGMGRISIPLARVVNRVVACDQSLLRMKFLQLRAKREGLANLEVSVADIFNLPYPKASFDLVVMNGVLEWVGVTDKFANPREAQIASLRICRDLLKPDGYLYIGIENRLALAYLRGPDHLGLWFTSYLPRWLANVYTKWRLGRSYNTYTYTKRGYEKLLREAGFTTFSFYLPYPGYNMPRLMIPYDNLKALEYVISNLMPAGGLLRQVFKFVARWSGALWLYRFFFFSYGIAVQK